MSKLKFEMVDVASNLKCIREKIIQASSKRPPVRNTYSSNISENQ